MLDSPNMSPRRTEKGGGHLATQRLLVIYSQNNMYVT